MYGLSRAATSVVAAASAALVVLACLAPNTVPTAASHAGPDRSASEDLAQRLHEAPLPARDPFELAVRLRGVSPEAVAIAPPVPSPRCLGDEEDFWILDQSTVTLFTVTAVVRHISGGTDVQGCTLLPGSEANSSDTLCEDCARAYWYVQKGMEQRAPAIDIQRSAAVFERQTYPSVRQHFGPEPAHGVDGDPHLVFLMGNVPGVAAYFSSADSYPRVVNPRSNEHDMMYVNLQALRPGSATFDGVIAHEFQHMVHSNRCPYQETWVDEGAAELATVVAGFGGRNTAGFAANPDVQLTAWRTGIGQISRHYEAAFLFTRYLMDRFGGPSVLPEMFSSCGRGTQQFEPFLQGQGVESFDSVVADWATANFLNDRHVDDGRYGYLSQPIQAALTATLQPGEQFTGQVSQYAAQYVEVPVSAEGVHFEGAATVPLVQPVPGTGESVWWSNRADSLNSRLTRAVDLRNVAAATLQFRAWFEIEPGFDFVYLSVSEDGGHSWTTLDGRFMQSDHEVGNAFGNGWTGSSTAYDPGGWVMEEVDLTPFVGKEVLLRFEHLTDQGYNEHGFAWDDLSIPEVGLFDEAASDDAWHAEGWLRVDAPLPQSWHLRLVEWRPGGVEVRAVASFGGGADIDVSPDADRAVLVMVPTAPRTLEPGSYTLSTEPRG